MKVGAAAIMMIGGDEGNMDTEETAVINSLYIPNPMDTHNPFMCHPLYAIYLSNRPASIWCFRLTFVDIVDLEYNYQAIIKIQGVVLFTQYRHSIGKNLNKNSQLPL